MLELKSIYQTALKIIAANETKQGYWEGMESIFFLKDTI